MKNQKGVTMVTLVITIIVILILAGLTFIGSLKTINQTNYSKYVSNVSDVSAAFGESAAIVKGQKIMEDKKKEMGQIHNYLAKNGDEEKDFLKVIDVPRYTIIRDEGQIGIDLPDMVVESGTGKKIPVKYAATAEGKIFTWPPLDHEDKFYITDEDTVEHKMQTTIKVGNEEFQIKIDSGDGSLLDWLQETPEDDEGESPSLPSGDEGDSPLAHEHDFSSKTQTAEYFCSDATCVLPKKYYYKCISCDAKGSETYTVGEALGHIFEGETLIKEANCTEKGVIQSKCTRCGAFANFDRPINPANHHGGEREEITKQPTCTETGTKSYKCSSCNETLRTVSIDMIDHNMDKVVTTKQPTCTEKGIKVFKCSSCDKEMKTEEIAALGHGDERAEITKEPTCTEKGTKIYKCSICGVQIRTESINALGHSYGNFQETTAATCTKKGVRTKKCTRCNDTITEEIDALDHNYGSFVVTKEPTCLEKGERTQTCSRCNDEITEDIDALGHDWSAPVPPRKCNRCGLEENAEYTYNILYKSTSGLDLGSTTLTKFFGTTNTVVAPEITGYNTPASQSIVWDTETKIITFIYSPTDYSITINCNGGSGVSSTSYNIETPTFTLKTPTREGYTFLGWTGSNGNTPETMITIEHGSVGARNYTANWSIDGYTYNVVYKSKSGIDLGSTTVTNKPGTTNTVEAIEITGYNTPASQSVVWDSEEPKTITFIYEPIEYKVTLDLNGGILDSIVDVATVGDYVNYSANGVTSWRVFDIKDGIVYIIPADGPVGSVTLGYFDGYANAIPRIEAVCDEYINDELQIGTDDVRSMKEEDIYRVIGYTQPGTTKRAAWYLPDYYPGSGTVTYNGVKYTRYRLSDSGHRFYEWDYSAYTTTDETGNTYAYPRGSNPVYQTIVTVPSLNISSYNHVLNPSIKVASLFTSDYGWLASKTTSEGDGWAANFYLKDVNSTDGISRRYTVDSAGDGGTRTRGVIPMVALGSNINASRQSSSDPWNLGDIVEIPYTVETETFTLRTPTREGCPFVGWTGSNGTTPQTSVSISKGSTGNKDYIANWQSNEVAQAIYSADDNSLTFIRRTTIYATGDNFTDRDGINKIVTAAYTGFEEDRYAKVEYVPWSEYMSAITSVVFEDKILPISTSYWFHRLMNCASMDVSNLDVSNVVSMKYMFNYTLELESIYGIESWNTSKVTNLSGMFSNSKVKNLDLNKWDTSLVTDTSWMFSGTNFEILKVDNFDTSSVTDMRGMFKGAGGLTSIDLRSWDVRNVTNMDLMFAENKSLETINVSGWNTNKVNFISFMFGSCEKLKTIEGIDKWDTSNVTDMTEVFCSSELLESLDLSKWDTSKVESMYSMFKNCESLKTVGDMSEWNTENVENMVGMFWGCHNLEDINLTKWNVKNVVDMNAMFAECYNLVNLGNLKNWSTSNVININGMFYKCWKLTELDLSGWNTSNIINMRDTFYNCYVRSLNLDGWDTTNVADMSDIFYNAKKLEKITLGTGFKFVGTNCYFPTPLSSEIVGATGLWYRTSDGKSFAPSEIPNNEAATYIAVNKNCTYNVEYKSESGLDLGSTTVTKWYGTTNTIVAPAITGYNTPASQNVTWDSETKTITFTYEPTSYSITIDCNGGSGVSSTSYDIETPTFTLGTPTRTGYTFLGWTDINGTTQASVTIVKGSIGAKSYTANWEAHVAQAIYSATDDSLTFIKDSEQIVGSTYNGKTITEIYTGFETATYNEETLVPWANYLTSIKTVYFDDEIIPVSTSCWFYGMTACTTMNLTNLNTSNVTNMYAMFRDCSILTSLDVSHFDTKKVTNMRNMFRGLTNITSLNLENFDTTLVNDMYTMFGYSTNLKNLYISNFNTAKVQDMQKMFINCSSLTSLDFSHFNTSEVMFMNFMFQGAGFVNLDLSSFYTPKVKNMRGMFSAAPNLKTITLDNTKFITTNVTDMNQMFAENSKLTTVDVSKFDTRNVTDMGNMFANCVSLQELDVSNWNVSKVENMDNLFDDCQVVSKLDVSKWDTSSATSMRGMFQRCYAITELDVSGFDTSNVVNMELMLASLENISYLDVSGFNTSNVTNMYGVFNASINILSLDVTNFDTSKVTDMERMFYACRSLTELDVSSFDTKNVTNMVDMFRQCRNLTTIYASDKFVTTNVLTSTDMFLYSTKLVGGAGTTYSSSYVEKSRARIDLGSSGRGYFTNYLEGPWVSQAIYTESDNTLTFLKGKLYKVGDKYNNKTISAVYTDFERQTYTETTVPWYEYRSEIKVVKFVDGMMPVSTAYWFNQMTALTDLDITLDDRNVTNTSYMYAGTNFTDMSLGSFEFSKTTNMEGMFADCKKVENLDISNLNTSKVTNMKDMFKNCNHLEKITLGENFAFVGTNGYLPTPSSEYIEGADGKWYNSTTGTGYIPANVPNNTAATYVAKNLNYKARAIYTSSDKTLTFIKSSTNYVSGGTYNGKTITAVYTGFEDTTYTETTVPWYDYRSVIETVNFVDGMAPISTAYWFNKMIVLKDLDITLDDRNVTNTSYMYAGTNFTDMSLGSFEFSKTTNMEGMFADCKKVENLDISNLNTSSVTNMKDMFKNCNHLEKITLGENFAFVGTNGYLPTPSSEYIEGVDGKWYNESTGIGYTPENVPNNTAATYIAINKNYTYNVEYKSESGLDLGSTTVTKWYGTTNTIVAPAITGYNTPASQNVTWDSETKTITFIYEPTSYSITINCNGGSGVSSTSYDIETPTFTLKTPTRSGYTFTGWTDINGVTQASVTIVKGSIGAKSYTANWEEYVAQAIYSATDDSLTFIKDSLKTVGGTFVDQNGKTKAVTARYVDIETFEYKTTFETEYPYTEETNVGWIEYGSVITSVVVEDNISPISTSGWFFYFDECNNFDIEKLNTSNVKDMSFMFAGCDVLTSIDVSKFDTKNVTNMAGMFYDNRELTSVGNLANWDTSKVTDMHSMFENCWVLPSLNINGWDTSNVTTTKAMFASCNDIVFDVSNWNTSSNTDMSSMFYSCYSITQLDLRKWDTSKVTDMTIMFGCCGVTYLNASGWDTSNVTSMHMMFYECTELETLNLTGWQTDNLQSLYRTFWNCNSLKSLDLSGWNVSKVTDMSETFLECISLTSVGNISNWNTSNVENMYMMFCNCESLGTLNLSKWDVKKVTSHDWFNYRAYNITPPNWVY